MSTEAITAIDSGHHWPMPHEITIIISSQRSERAQAFLLLPQLGSEFGAKVFSLEHPVNDFAVFAA